MTIQVGIRGHIPAVLIKPATPSKDLTVIDLLRLLEGVPSNACVVLEGTGTLNKVVKHLDEQNPPLVILRHAQR